MANVGRPERTWETVASRSDASWYLDPLVAAQKRRAHLSLLNDWSAGVAGPILKTDLFEEAHGGDELLSGFPSDAALVGMDVAPSNVVAARRRFAGVPARFLVTDCRALGLATDSMGCVFSNSTLDHFATRAELETSLAELVRVLRPGGTLIVTLDNPRNPLYQLLKVVTRTGLTPFGLGATLRLDELTHAMRRAGLEVTDTAYLIHNPRLISTGLFFVLRRLFGRRADGPIRVLVEAFARLERLPTRGYTACFVAACGRKRPEAVVSRG